jgi:hypothetical protein
MATGVLMKSASWAASSDSTSPRTLGPTLPRIPQLSS